ncbi:pentatricopeptide repeat-containing protein At5g39350 [Mercurialis annua]|uniref:pentatricopeptide repeat-containing protein At5g39350 n=1 Tax=Mercurialis annua TaxID=3986 RepID=UPI00215F4360|nr:pentatricopeptide repeat-containing protein At5g39350 [Mercurialis annua]XP_050230418.1 pentatricopeptide repeat-containing protein At5g39350 [Mercurialis annua]
MNGAKRNQYLSLLKHCAATKCLTKTKQLHANTITASLLSILDPTATHLRSALALSYMQCGSIPVARKLFDELPDPSVLLYNNLITMYMNSKLYFDALNVFVEMLQSGDCLPDNFTYPAVIKACSELGLTELGKAIHGKTVVSIPPSNTFVNNALVAMYMSCGEKDAAERVFDGMKERSVVSWNGMISGYYKIGCAKKSLIVFDEMVELGVEIDCASVVSVLPACGYLKELEVGRRVHVLVEEKGLGNKIAVRNALIDMYAKCGSLDEARVVFDGMDERDVISWTSLLNGYILSGDVRTALTLCRTMQRERIRPNAVTIASILSACVSLRDGRCLHGWIMRQHLDSEVIVETSLIDMYAKCNRVDLSYKVFTRASVKRTSPCNAMLSGCIHNGLATEAIGLFKQMLLKGVEPDSATFNSLLPAYAILAELLPAKNMHCYLTRSGFLSVIEVSTCLIDIYSKCGSLESAHEIFNDIPSAVKDIFVWSVIISGYGMHGHGETAVSLFRQMVQSGVKPNEITFTSVLHACSHAGLVDEGLQLLEFMHLDLKTSPREDHYTCIVDLLGRSGRLDEAYDMIRTMPFMPGHSVWGALLGACVIHENVELGEVAARRLFDLEPENTGNYVLLAKLYSAVGRWKDAENVRRMMDCIGLRKAPAQSLIDAINT